MSKTTNLGECGRVRNGRKIVQVLKGTVVGKRKVLRIYVYQIGYSFIRWFTPSHCVNNYHIIDLTHGGRISTIAAMAFHFSFEMFFSPNTNKPM